MAKFNFALVICVLVLNFWFLPYLGSAQLRPNFYSNPNSNFCPNLENIVKGVVSTKVQQTFVTIPATLRLFFHDCFVNGCDASVIIQSAGSNVAEKDHPDNLSLAGDGFDTVIKAKAAVDKQCGANKVSCADILALATRDVVVAAGGPSWQVELGRKDGFVSTKSSVEGNLPKPTFNLNQLNAMFNRNGLSQTDMIALSGAHTLGFSHCSKFSNRIYSNPPDPTMNKGYAAQLRQMCPKNVNPLIAINMDPVTPKSFDIQYYKNLQQGKGLFTSDQVLFTDSRSRGLVNAWATNSGIAGFNQAFTTAMIKLGRVGVKTGKQGNVRKFCDRFN